MLEILISSSVLILVLALLRLVLRDKVSARLQYALWLLVLVRLLVPVSFFRSPVSVAELTAPAVTRVEALSDTAVRYASLYAGTDTLAEPDTVGTFEKTEAVPALTLRALAQYIRYAGMVVMAAWFILVNLRLARRLKKTRTPYEYNSAMPVYVAADIPSPCLFGLFKPAIYLTERAAEDAAQARQIIAHELTHFRHGDMIWALLRSVCLVVWWFDPFVWLAAALSRRDGELACDEGTIKALGEDARFDYGRTLVGMAKVGARPSDLLCGATTMTAGKKSLKERVARIANAPKMSVTLAAVVLLIAALAVGCTFSGSVSAKNGADAPEPTPTPQLWEGESVAEASTSDADEFILYFSEYLSEGVGAEDFDTWAAYIYFAGENDLQLSRDNYIPIFRGEIVAYERLSDGLAAFLVSYLDSEDTPVSECLHFVGRYDGRLYVFRNKASLPEELCSALEKLTLPDPFEDDPDIMIPDASYWEEVERELAPFARSDRIETSYTPGFDPDLPEDDIFGPLTLEDYVYGTDSWQFTYNGEPIANDPFAVIKILDDNDRTLWIMDDADALMIEEADGSITWVDYAGDPVDCADMIRHLLPWASGKYEKP